MYHWHRSMAIVTTMDRIYIVGFGAAGQSSWPARDWTSQISDEAVASVGRELNVVEALMWFFTSLLNIIAARASVNRVSDDEAYDIVGCGAPRQAAPGPLRSATRL